MGKHGCGVPLRLAGPYAPAFFSHRHHGYPTHRISSIDPPPRKRISVACGRCRKRKIRCSGDSGDGEPCTNCKNSGYEPCQFLRVSSQMAQMRGERFPYGSLEAARRYQARRESTLSPAPSTSTGTIPESPPLPMQMQHNDPLTYRPSSTLAYAGRAPYYPVPAGWSSNYADDQGPNQGVYASPTDTEYNIGYRMSAGSSSSQASPPSGGFCVEAADTNWVYGSSSTATSSVANRQSPGSGSDSAGLPFTATQLLHQPSPVIQTLSMNAAPSDRLLPAPTSRTPSVTGPSIYRANSLPITYGRASTSGSAPNTPEAETPSGYTIYESSSGTAYPAMSPATQMGRPQDLYTMSSASAQTPVLSSTEALRGPTSSGGPVLSSHSSSVPVPEMTYRYTDTTSADTITTEEDSEPQPKRENEHGASSAPHRNDSTPGGMSINQGSAFMHQLHGQPPSSYMVSSVVGGGGSTGEDSSSEQQRKRFLS